MITTTWKTGVNTRFYGMSKKPKENTVLTEYTSGRTTAYQKNTKKVFTYSVKIKLSQDTEAPLFWAWFNDELGQTAGFFTCSALGSGTYRFLSVPDPEDTDTETLTLNLELEEV